MAVSAIFGFGRNEKKPFGRTLIHCTLFDFVNFALTPVNFTLLCLAIQDHFEIEKRSSNILYLIGIQYDKDKWLIVY